MARTRSTKKLSQRIDREYFKRLYPIPRWRRTLSLVATGVGLAWVLGSLAVNSGAVFNAGPLSKGHHILEGNCATCHTGTALWGRKVEEKACVACHDGPAHKEQQVFTPSCLSCHIEHKGKVVEITDASCTQCHGSLQTKNGKLTVAAKVTGFDSNHPEFKPRTDAGTIKFGHQIHMKAGLRGADGPVQLKCSTCHTPDAAGRMSTANFARDCESCHRLEFHRKVNAVLPHDRPEVALAFARKALSEYIAAHPNDVNLVEPALDPRILVERQGPAGNAAEWIRRGMEDTETLMWRKTCVECHTPSAAREIPKAQIAAQWFQGAKFGHAAHQLVACAECHGQAASSKATADVLLPGMQTCVQCHRSSEPSASVNCTECHAYHDLSKAKPIDTRRTIKDLLR